MNNIHTCSSVRLFGCPSHTDVSYHQNMYWYSSPGLSADTEDILRPFQPLGEVPGYVCQRHQQKQAHRLQVVDAIFVERSPRDGLRVKVRQTRRCSTAFCQNKYNPQENI
jgi:hypothetical protein